MLFNLPNTTSKKNIIDQMIKFKIKNYKNEQNIMVNMADLLIDPTNLKILNLIVSGKGVEVNISKLAKKLNKHRKTVKVRVNHLFENNIINKPQYPLSYLFKHFPLMVISRTNLLRDRNTKHFIEFNDHIYAAFFFKEEEYNTLMISFHDTVCAHVQWLEACIKNEVIPKREGGYPSQVLYLGTGCFEKYNPSVSIKVIEKNLKTKRQKTIKGLELDDLTFEILNNLLHGYGIRTNENFLAKELNVHRRTIEKRIKIMHKEGVIGRPVCYFPRIIVPPEYILVKSLVQIKKQEEQVIQALKNDPHITWMIKAVTGRGGFNLVAFSTFYKIEDHLEWQEELDQRFPECIGSLEDTYLSPKMTFSIDPEFVSLCIIQNKLKKLEEANKEK